MDYFETGDERWWHALGRTPGPLFPFWSLDPPWESHDPDSSKLSRF